MRHLRKFLAMLLVNLAAVLYVLFCIGLVMLNIAAIVRLSWWTNDYWWGVIVVPVSIVLSLTVWLTLWEFFKDYNTYD